MKRIAEALVECGYALDIANSFDFVPKKGIIYLKMTESKDYFQIGKVQEVDPFADTLEGRRQADALEDWLITANSINYDIDGKLLWDKSEYINDDNGQHQWRLDRIKWCFEQLEEDK